MKSAKVTNVLKIADFDSCQLDPEVLNWFVSEGKIAFADQTLKEHIYDVETDNIEELNCSKNVKEALRSIRKKLDKKGCSYLRITYW